MKNEKPAITQAEIYNGLAGLYKAAIQKGDTANALKLAGLMLKMVSTEKARILAGVAMRNPKLSMTDRNILASAIKEYDSEPFSPPETGQFTAKTKGVSENV